MKKKNQTVPKKQQPTTQEDSSPMTPFKACSIAEGFCGYEPSDEEQREAWQYIVDTRQWQGLQGWYGRTARDLISEGLIKDTHGDFTGVPAK